MANFGSFKKPLNSIVLNASLVLNSCIMGAEEFVKSSRVLNPIESGQRRIGDFFKSFIGLLFGIVLVLFFAPYLIFISEFQYTAQNLSKAVPGELGSPQNGYVYLYGLPSLKSESSCPVLENQQCIFFDYKKEKLSSQQGVLCGQELTDSKRINVERLSQAPDKCAKRVVREGGADVEKEFCEQCFNSSWKEWKVVDSRKNFAGFSLGVNSINPPQSALVKFTESSSKSSLEGEESLRETVSFLPASKEVLVVGAASNGLIDSGNPFVLSSRSFEATKQQLGEEQASESFLNKIFAFILFAVGFFLIFNPINKLIEIFGAIPFIGDAFIWVSNFSAIVLAIIAVILALILTIILSLLFIVLRLFVDNFLIVVLITALILFALFFGVGKVFKQRQ